MQVGVQDYRIVCSKCRSNRDLPWRSTSRRREIGRRAASLVELEAT